MPGDESAVDESTTQKPPQDIVMEERASMPYALAPFDRSIDMKIWNRRWKIYWLWLEADLTQEEIAKMVGIERWTVNKDLAAIREFLRFVPQRYEDMLQEIYMRMVHSRNEIQQDARNAEKYSDKAKLWTIVGNMDSKLLERFTQRKGKADVHVDAPASSDMGKFLLEYIGETYGPDAVKHALKWMENKVRFATAMAPK